MWGVALAWAVSAFWEPLRPYQRHLQLITFLGGSIALPLEVRRALNKPANPPDQGKTFRKARGVLPPERWPASLKAIRTRFLALLVVAEIFILICIAQALAQNEAAEAWYGGAAALLLGAGAAAMLSRCPRCGGTFFKDPKPSWSFRAGPGGFGFFKSGFRLSHACGTCGLSWKKQAIEPAG